MKRYRIILIAVASFFIINCKEDAPKITPITNIKITPNSVLFSVGDRQQINAEPIPENADPEEMPFIWESDNPEIAVVNQSGQVTGVSTGVTNVTVSAKKSGKVFRKIYVKVTEKIIPLEDITVVPESLKIDIDEQKSISVNPVPADASAFSLKWDSENKDIATVNSNGLVTGKAEGTTNLIVKSGDIIKKIPVMVTWSFRISMNNTSYKVDTLNYEIISEGIEWLKFSLPEFTNGFNTFGKGLIVNTLEVDLSVPGNSLEVCPASQATWGNIERPTAMLKRKEAEYKNTGKKPIAAINGDFYLLASGNNTGYAYINNRPLGPEITNGMVTQTPFSISGGFIIRDDGSPAFSERITFSGSVDAGEETFLLAEVNGYAGAGEMVFFNNLSNSWPTDSAFAWSPYTSTMVSLSFPEGGWRVNDRMEFTVTDIEHNVETTIPAASPYKGKDFNGQGGILVGNSSAGGNSNDSKKFLSGLNIGDKIGITMNINDGTSAKDKYLNIVGFNDLILKSGSPVNNWNEAHPRTAIGYSHDKTKVYMVVVDGRQNNYSAGATTGQVGSIMKAIGAYNGVNLDGGGSSCMVINNEIRNKPSDGSERPVANGVIVLTNRQ